MDFGLCWLISNDSNNIKLFRVYLSLLSFSSWFGIFKMSEKEQNFIQRSILVLPYTVVLHLQQFS